MSSIFDFPVPNTAGEPVTISSGKSAYLLINVASAWGFTASNYREMAELYGKHGSVVEIVAIPSNDYGAQEPGTNEEILAFAQARGATYTVTGKISTAPGTNQSPLYKYLTTFEGNGMTAGPLKWNFEKFLIGSDGVPVKRYASKVSPLAIEGDILNLL